MTTNTELKKSAEPHDRTQPNTASGGMKGDSAGRAKHEGLERGESGADGARVADQHGWGAAQQGIRMMTAIQAQVAQAGLDQGQRVLGTALRLAETYRAATERTANRVQALTDSCTSAGRSLQNWHQECLAQFRRSAEHLAAKQQDFVRCRSPADLIKVQLDIYGGAINDLLRANAVLFDLAAQTAQNTATSLRDREATGE